MTFTFLITILCKKKGAETIILTIGQKTTTVSICQKTCPSNNWSENDNLISMLEKDDINLSVCQKSIMLLDCCSLDNYRDQLSIMKSEKEDKLMDFRIKIR